MQKTLLKEGSENPVIRFGSLEIEPVNLYIQSAPRNDRSPHAELELRATEKGQEYHTHLIYYEGTNGRNNSLVFNEHLLSLKVDESRKGTRIWLVVERNDFGKEFYVEPFRDVVIGDLTIKYIECVYEMASFEPGGEIISGAYYSLGLSSGGEQQKLSFTSYEINDDNPFLTEWKNYKIWISYHETLLKMKVDRVVVE